MVCALVKGYDNDTKEQIIACILFLIEFKTEL